VSLRSFHLLFIALAVVLAAFFAAWATSQYRELHQTTYLLAAVGSVVIGGALAVYGAAFQRKTRTL
jgi:FlaG/FlaF family flagellin (archaellin)